MKVHHFIPVALLFLGACAGYSVKSADGEHYPVYRPQPYLLVVSGQDSPKVIYLPDYSRAYQIKSWSLLGKADFEFEIADGWQLTKISDKSSNQELVKSLEALAKDAMGSRGGPEILSGKKQEIDLYRIDIDEKTGSVMLEKVDTR